MEVTRAVWVCQERVWVGHGLPGLIARTASELLHRFQPNYAQRQRPANRLLFVRGPDTRITKKRWRTTAILKTRFDRSA